MAATVSAGWRREMAWVTALAMEEAAMDFKAKAPFSELKEYEAARARMYKKENLLCEANWDRLKRDTESGRAKGSTLELRFKW